MLFEVPFPHPTAASSDKNETTSAVLTSRLLNRCFRAKFSAMGLLPGAADTNACLSYKRGMLEKVVVNIGDEPGLATTAAEVLGDPAPSNNGVTVVKHGRLPGRDGPLRLVEGGCDFVLARSLDDGRRRFVAMPNLDGDPHWSVEV
jgi:hypothetical protein